MLGKLIKYEFKATYSIHMLMCAVVLGLAVVSGLFALIPTGGVDHTAFAITALVASMMQLLLSVLNSVIFIVTMVLIAVRFYKNLLGGDEGYLMFTLPVSRGQLLWSKLIVATCYMFMTMFTVILSYVVSYLPFVLSNITDVINIQDLLDSLKLGYQKFMELMYSIGLSDFSIISLMVAAGIFLFLSLPTSVLRFYSSVSLGHLAKKHRVLWTFGAYFMFYAIYEILLVVALVVLTMVATSVDTTQGAILLVQIAVYALPIIALCQCLLHYFLTKYVMNKRLNLQ